MAAPRFVAVDRDAAAPADGCRAFRAASRVRCPTLERSVSHSERDAVRTTGLHRINSPRQSGPSAITLGRSVDERVAGECDPDAGVSALGFLGCLALVGGLLGPRWMD